MFELKWHIGVFFHNTGESDAKFEDELTCQFKIDTRDVKILDLSTQKSQKLALNGLLLLTRVLKNFKKLLFDGLLLTKVYNV